MPWDALKPAIVSGHPGSSEQEIEEEPNWSRGHDHRIGYLNRQGRLAGLTHDGDYDPYETEEDREFRREALRKHRDLREKSQQGQLVNFQDVMKGQTVSHFRISLGVGHLNAMVAGLPHAQAGVLPSWVPFRRSNT